MSRFHVVSVAILLATTSVAFADDPSASPPASVASPSPVAPQPAPAQPGAKVPGADLAPSPTLAIVNDATLDDRGEKGGVSPAVLRAEVMLDRVHASPGVIDGRGGENFDHAIEVYEKAKHLKVGRGLDKQVWDALVKETGGPVLREYTLSDEDVAGPFMPVTPRNYADQAKLKTLAYHSPAQKIAAKFHLSERLLAALNPGVDLAKAGTRIVATIVEPKPLHEDVHRIVVNKAMSEVLGYDRKGRLIVAYPATIGSRELPSPSGTYKIKGIAQNPIYYYNPKNFIQDDNHEKLRLPPGPNNPVGSVFMALTKPTYGLHGTPDPDMIDKTASHGCVRMTNWDAEQLAHLVHRGVVVHFEK